MKLPFTDEFETTKNGITYYVSAAGIREWDEEERLFTSLSRLTITDEFGTKLTDNDDVYNEIYEKVMHSNVSPESLTEEVSFEENY